MRVLIVEDETVAARGLITKLQKSDHNIEVVAQTDSVKETVQWLREHQTNVDLVFLDIHLKDGSCFEIFEQLRIKLPVIFCTAYEEYALRAFEVNSLYYLLKPFSQEDIDKALGKYREIYTDVRLKNISYSDLLSALGDSPNHQYRSRFLVKVGKKYYYINVDEISYITIENKIVYAKTTSAKISPLNHTIEELEKMLPPNQFFRINRQQIVAIKGVADFFNDYGRLTVQLKHYPDKKVYVSRKRVEQFKAWLNR